jgi:PAS domain S-box-containing protein
VLRRGGKLPGHNGQASKKDVTDQCQAELEHRALEVRFAHAFESAPFGMSLVSARPESLGRYVRANQAYCEMVGYPQEELLTMAEASVVHPDDAEDYNGVRTRPQRGLRNC